MCSLSKTAGFTGTRCGYTVIPKELERDGHNIYATWYRRQATKFNGVSWPVQCAAAAVFSEEGQKQIKENISYYQENARIIASALDELGIYYTGGKNSPYIWLKCPNNMGSWEFFDLLLNEANVVGTPGEGFGETVPATSVLHHSVTEKTRLRLLRESKRFSQTSQSNLIEFRLLY